MKISNLVYIRFKETLQENKLPMLISLSIYFLGFSLGIFLSCTYSSITENLEVPFMSENELILQSPPTFEYIFVNNIKVISILLSGSFLFGYSTFMNLICNGLFFGGILAEYLKETPFTKVLLLTTPHAIFELPAILIAGAAGFKIPYELLRYINGQKNYILKRKEIIDFLILTCFSIFLIFIAAFVESYITIMFLRI